MTTPAAEATFEEVARSDERQWTGVAVSHQGRIFVNYPRWAGPHENSVEELLAGGSRRPYPSESWNGALEGAPPAERFVCVQSVHVDAANRLWILDPAAPRFEGPVEGGPKLVLVDLSTDEVIRVYSFGPEVAPEGSYLNDVRVRPETSRAYVTDSGLGALVVVDLESGSAWRVLAGHSSTLAEEGLVPQVGGSDLRLRATGQPPQVHSDGIALDSVGGYVYWQALTGRTLYRIATAFLDDPEMPAEQVTAAVERVAETVVTDGMAMDRAGNLYLSALEEDAVIYRTPAGELQTLVTTPLLAWPDSFAVGVDGWLYVTTSQIHLTAGFTADGSMPSTPYRLFRAPLP